MAEAEAAALYTEQRALQRPGFTGLQLANRLVVRQVGRGLALRTVEQLARDGRLRVVGQERAQHSRRPLNLYAPATPEARVPDQAPDLALQVALASLWVA